MDLFKKQSTMVFIDLDDTIFQTRRKNAQAIIQATESSDPLTVSYMSDEQYLLLELLKSHEKSCIVPVTARDYSQYLRTNMSKDFNVSLASICFGAEILLNNEADPIWKDRIQAGLQSLNSNIPTLLKGIDEVLNKEVFNIRNVNDYYLVIKHKNKVDYQNEINECYSMLINLLPSDLTIYQNDNNITIVPKCIDKRNAVNYLIEMTNPKLTIGVGDSNSDWNFMDACDYKIIPKKSQINKTIISNLLLNDKFS